MKNNKALERAEIVEALRCCGNTDTKRPDCEHCPLMGPMCVKRMLEGAAALLEQAIDDLGNEEETDIEDVLDTLAQIDGV